MKYSGLQIVFQEIPNEISLAIHITGCPQKCVGCHSSDLWDANIGFDLNPEKFHEIIARYSKYISCILFMGGEWQQKSLLMLFQIAREYKKKVALYTGLQINEIPYDLIINLDYIKYGPYISNLGGLNSRSTNQRLINLKTKEVLNSFFTEDSNDSVNR